MQPTRQAYGALLLEQGGIEEAAAVYAADLGLDPALARPCQHPGNVRSLHGYHECLQRLRRTAEAGIIGQQLALAGSRADVPILASCACRLEVDHLSVAMKKYLRTIVVSAAARCQHGFWRVSSVTQA
jgi:hypothetical protein